MNLEELIAAELQNRLVEAATTFVTYWDDVYPKNPIQINQQWITDHESEMSDILCYLPSVVKCEDWSIERLSLYPYQGGGIGYVSYSISIYEFLQSANTSKKLLPCSSEDILKLIKREAEKCIEAMDEIIAEEISYFVDNLLLGHPNHCLFQSCREAILDTFSGDEEREGIFIPLVDTLPIYQWIDVSEIETHIEARISGVYSPQSVRRDDVPLPDYPPGVPDGQLTFEDLHG